MPEDHSQKIVALGLDMLSSMSEFNQNENPCGSDVEIRIGIHSGSIVSGVIFSQAFSFDWFSIFASETHLNQLGGCHN